MINSYLLATKVIDLDNMGDIARSLDLPPRPEASAAPPTDDAAYPLIQRVYAAVLPLPYRFCPRDMTASGTWSIGKGSCYNKTNLFVALCRCAGVPAGYRMFRYKKTAFAAALGGEHHLYQQISDATIHVLPVVWFRGRWVDIDCCDDPEYARYVHDYDPPARWEGQDICNVEPQELVAELGIWAELDSLLSRPTRWTQADYDQMNARIEQSIASAKASRSGAAATAAGPPPGGDDTTPR